jgi:integrase/recombinase XerD
MQFIAHRIIEEPAHVTADEVHWRYTLNFLVVGLPQRSIANSAAFLAQFRKDFRDSHLLKVLTGQPAFVGHDRGPACWIHHTSATVDVRRLLAVPDSHYPLDCVLSPDTMRTLLLLLYGTGLRLSEATRLKHEDAEFRNGALTIRETKFGKSPLVPIGRDLVSILKLYRMRHRPGVGYQRPPTVLATKIGMMIRNDHAGHQFQWLRKEAGVLRFDNARYQPRLHDFRHTFAVTRLLTWYREGKDVQRMLPLLSTYLGHCRVDETSVYLQMTRELLQEANRRFEHYVFAEVHNG